MEEAFVIMQIGNPEMDCFCEEVIVPAIQTAGLIPRRVDRDEQGDLLKAEIVSFLERSQIIVADLTNERPNCYLEVGYAMGLGKKRNLILMVREDHHHSSSNYRHSGPKIHFDLEGYGLILWDPNDLDGARQQLAERIQRRVAVLQPTATMEPVVRMPAVDDEWLTLSRRQAMAGIDGVGRSTFMEAMAALHPKGQWRQALLLQQVRESQIHTFGWPIGIILDGGPQRPYATADGIVAEVAIVPNGQGGALQRRSYDYWALRKTGDFYLLKSLFEDEMANEVIYIDTRIVRTAELLLFLSRLYSRLEVPETTLVRVSTTYQGLKGRSLQTANPLRFMPIVRTTTEDLVKASVECTVAEMQPKLVELVRGLLEPLFVVFDFFELGDAVWRQIVDNFVAGRVG